MYRFVIGLFKIALASLLAGSLLALLGVTTDGILAVLGLTPTEVWTGIQAAGAWASPRIALGAMIVVPVWLITYILTPPRDD